MVLPRYAARTDGNQKDIVAALKKIGCSVLVIGTPVDLLIGYEAKNLLIECKIPGEKPRTKKQKDFLASWKGQVRIVESPEEAIKLVTESYSGGRGR